MDDRALAIALQKEYDREAAQDIDDEWSKFHNNEGSNESTGRIHMTGTPKSLIDPAWELLDPNPDIRSLFQEFNAIYFWSKLSMVEVRWSPRMTLCAGLCCYEGRGGLCSIRLSQPLLRLRPRKDLVETLLHEMIHALLFVTDNNKDHDGHGPEFCKHMQRINAAGGCNITIYHSFHDEVDHLRQHWWRCQGTCRTKPPYFGYVRRAMNRAPSSRDPWWPHHERTCGGTYIKVKEPEGYGKKKSEQTGKKQSNEKRPDILQILSQNGKSDLGTGKPSSSQRISAVKAVENSPGHHLGGSKLENSNPRGIPLTSRLLSAMNATPKASGSSSLARNAMEMRDKNSEYKWTELASSKKRGNHATNKALKKRIKEAVTIPELIARMKRNGQTSVNAGAEAFKGTPLVTSFGKKLYFQDSEDESSTEKENRNIRPKKCFPTKVDNQTTLRNPKPLHSFQPALDSVDGDPCDMMELCNDTNPNGVSLKTEYELSHMKGSHSAPNVNTAMNPVSFEVDFNENEAVKAERPIMKRLPSLSDEDESATLTEIWQQSSSKKIKLDDGSVNREKGTEPRTSDNVCCPICNKSLPLESINLHIDDCLSVQAIRDSSFS